MTAAPVLLAVDGDGLLHRAFHGIGDSSELDAAGRPVGALRGLVTFVAAAAARLRPDAVLVGFDSRVDPLRKALFPGYKGHRPPRSPELDDQLDAAPELLGAAGIAVARVPGYEGDDVLASAARLAGAAGWQCVVLTRDRDLFALLDDSTSVLRLMGDGIEGAQLLDSAALRTGYGVGPDQYRDYAALRGDTSDNLPGVRGIGSKTAARLLQAFGSADAACAAIDAGRGDEVAAVIGQRCADRLADSDSRQTLARNRELMSLHRDLALPGLESMRLPLDPAVLRSALRSRSITLGPSLWALVGAEPPPWTPNGFASAPKVLPGSQPPAWAERVVPSWEELRAADVARSREAAQRAAAVAASAAAGAIRAVSTQARSGGRAQIVLEGQLSLF